MRNARRFIVTPVTVLLAAALLNLSGVASASAPQIKPIDDTFSFTAGDICPFAIRVRTHITGRELLFTDQQGNPSLDVNHLVVYAVWRNPLSGKTVIERDHLSGVILPNDEGFLEIGLNFHLSLPSGSTVLIDAGRLVFDIDGNIVFQAGNHEFEDRDVGALCAALG